MASVCKSGWQREFLNTKFREALMWLFRPIIDQQYAAIENFET